YAPRADARGDPASAANLLESNYPARTPEQIRQAVSVFQDDGVRRRIASDMLAASQAAEAEKQKAANWISFALSPTRWPLSQRGDRRCWSRPSRAQPRRSDECRTLRTQEGQMANPTSNDFMKLSGVSGLNSYVRRDEIIVIRATAADKCAVFLRSANAAG